MNRLQEIEKRLSEIKVELEKDGADIDALEKEVKALMEEKKALLEKAEKRAKLLNDIATGAGNPIPDFIPKDERKAEFNKDTVLETPEYRNAFLKRLLGKELTEVEQRAYSSVDDSAGAVIPTQTANMLFTKMVKIAPMLNEITLLRVAGNLKIGVENVRDNASIHVENATINPTGDNLIYVTLAGYEYVKVIRISKTVQTMAISAFEGWLTDMLAEDISVAIEDDIINGTGTNEPKGIEFVRTWIDGTTAVKYLTADGLAYQDILDALGLLPARYLPGAKWLMNSATFFTKVAALVDKNGTPIYIRDIEVGSGYRIMGLPVILSDKVGAGVIYLGNFRNVVGNLSQDVLVESSTQSGFLNNAIDFKGTAIFDCDIALPDAFVKVYEAEA